MQTRRSFLKQSLAAGAATAAIPAIIPSRVLGQEAPSKKIVMGIIGVGGMGTGDMRNFLSKNEVHVRAVCDVDRRHRERAKQIVDKAYGNTDCATHEDFRDLIGRGDLDAVSIDLPDHWHAIPSIMAARAGLDIYGQKPLARSIREGRAIVDAVHRYDCVWQTGSQQRSGHNFRRAAELVRNGRVGKIERVEVGLPTGRGIGPQPVQPVPEGLNWDLWLGPAPWAPYTAQRCHFNWRWIQDYSGGQLTDWAGHHIDIAHWGLGLTHTGPTEIEATGVYPEDGLWNVPIQYHLTCKYANGVVMEVAHDKKYDRGTRWFGDKGWIFVSRSRIEAEPKSLLREVIGPEEIRLYESRNHHQNFLDCIKSRQPTVAPVDQAYRSISVAHLGEIAIMTGRKIKWDPEKEEIVGDPGAALLLGRTYREPWYY